MGIDISAKTVRAALIQKKGNAMQLLALVSEPIIDDALNHALLELKIKLNKACKLPWYFVSHQVMGVAQSNVALKRFCILPNTHEQEQYIQIGLQLAESLGLPVDDLLYDYCPLPQSEGVEVYACRRSVVDKSLVSLSDAGYQLSVIELQTHALIRLYHRQLKQKKCSESALILDLGYERLQICAGDDKSILFFRELPLSFDIQNESPTKARLTYNEQLVDIIQRQYQVAVTSLTGLQINCLWLSGENAQNVDILLLKERLQWDVKTLNPLQGFNYSSEFIDDLPEPACAWSIAMGLALREV